MSEPLVCICGHVDDQHEITLGYCEAKDCGCVCFRTEEEMMDGDDDEEEIDFDHGQ